MHTISRPANNVRVAPSSEVVGVRVGQDARDVLGPAHQVGVSCRHGNKSFKGSIKPSLPVLVRMYVGYMPSACASAPVQACTGSFHIFTTTLMIRIGLATAYHKGLTTTTAIETELMYDEHDSNIGFF